MIDTASLLDAAKSRQAIPTDYKLAQRVGISPTRMSGYRIGKSNPDEPTARKLAELAGLDADVVVVELQAQRAQSDEARAVWEGIAARLSRAGTAAAFVFAATFTGGPDGGAMASTLPSVAPANNGGALYIMSTCRAAYALACGLVFRWS